MPDDGSTTPPPSPQTPPPRWRDVWQVPVFALGGLLLVGGLTTAIMTKPKPDLSLGLVDAQGLVEHQQYEEALAVLNDKVLEGINKNVLSPQQQRDFHILRARCIALGQKERGIDRPENHRAVIGEFQDAERLHAELTPPDTVLLCNALLSLGETERAVRRLQMLPDSRAEDRTGLLKRAIDLSIHPVSTPDHPAKPENAYALDLLTLLTGDEHLGVADRAWALARQGEVMLARGYGPEAVMKIVKTLPRLDGAPDVVLGEIHFTLARAYEQQNELDEAARELERAAAMIEPGSPLIPPLTLLQGDVYHRKPSLGNARERYAVIIERFSFSNELAGALLGMAEVEAESLIAAAPPVGEPGESLIENVSLDGALSHSIDLYTRLAELIRAGGAGAETAERVAQSLLIRFREQFEGREPDYRTAMQLASLAEQLFGTDKAPPDVILALAQVHQRLAEDILATASGHGGVLTLADADPATQREAREHLIRAGEYFRIHAAGTVTSTGVYGESLWAAADCFDRAGDTDGAISAFQQFSTDFPSDPRQPEAAFRLAQSYQARGDLDLASRIYRQLIAGRDTGERAGPFADASYVPLAQTLLSDAETGNDAEGEELLLAVVNGGLGGTRTPAFRTALRELGQRYYQIGRYERAIERYEELLARTSQEANISHDSGLETARFKLADSYRLSAAALALELTSGAMPEGERREKLKAREERLAAAGAAFDEVRAGLEAEPHRTALEDVYLRNTYFYLGACAFDRKDYSAAIAHYDAARERYPKDPASLVAMVQVVSAYLAMGDVAKATLANERAQRFFDSIPPQAWDQPNLPMGKQDWQQWLTAKDDLKRASQERGSASAAAPE